MESIRACQIEPLFRIIVSLPRQPDARKTKRAMPEDRLKYLEFIQAAISRMAANSFLIKGWSVTLGTAVLGFSLKENNWAMALVALIPASSFWALDAYYLGLERLFRD